MSHRTGRNHIGILGAGRWGTVLAQTVAASGKAAVLYARDPANAEAITATRRNERHLPELERLDDRIEVTHRLSELTERCTLIFVALSVTEMRPTIRALGDTLDGSHIVVHAVRGLEPETLATPSAIVAQETCARKIGALMGPALVAEMLAGRPCAAVVASRFPEAIAATRAALVGPTMRVYSNNDLVGVEAASAAAHIMALAVGIQAELALGPATRAVLITRGVAEVARLCEALGGKASTAFGLSGLGDLLVYAEREGAEVEAGRRLARGQSREAITEDLGELEAFKAAQTFHALATQRGVEAQITAAIHDMLYAGLSPAEALMRLMTLGQMNE